MTLRHIVSWKLGGATLEERNEQAARIIELIEALPAKISQIKALSVHRNELFDGANYDVTLIADFDDADGLAEYAVHPDHLPVVEVIKELAVGRVATDFTV